MEREVTQPVDLWRDGDGGAIDPAAIGWTRRALHRCRLDRPWGRRKRWHYWCVASAREVVSLTLADLDYAGVAAVIVHDRVSGRSHRELAVRPLGWNVRFPDSPTGGHVAVRRGRLALDLDDGGERIRLAARGRHLAAELELVRPPGHEVLAVAVSRPPFAQYSSKDNCLPARGWLTLDGFRRPIAPGAWGFQDWGRGVWPAHTRWNWAAAAGTSGGRTIGINLGAQWTDGGGATENGVCVDGRLTKLGGDVRFAWDRRDPRRPWRLTGDGVDLTLVPEIVDGVAGPRGGPLPIRLCYGGFHGRVLDLEVRDLFGWAEELEILW